MDGERQTTQQFFISRAGKNPADAAMAQRVGQLLEAAGNRVTLQDWDFPGQHILATMDEALASGARVIAILTPEYLATDNCTAEWGHVLKPDPLNRKGRLIVLRAAPCEPGGLLSHIAYWNLTHLDGSDEALAELLRMAIVPGAERRKLPPQHSHWRTEARPLLHPAIRHTENFAGRGAALLQIDEALWMEPDAAAAITQPAAITGLGGVGKSTLAREYGWEAREGYAGVWWLDAAGGDPIDPSAGIQRGLVELGEYYQPGISEFQDRAKAARHVLEILANAGFGKPWLLIFDNVDDAEVFKPWRPHGNVRALITTRLDKWGKSVSEIEIAQLPIDDAIQFLRDESDRDDIDADDARAIANDLGSLPLALSHAATYLRDNTLATADSYRADIAHHMKNAPRGVAYPDAVFATFTQQIAQADKRKPGARAVLSLAAFLAPDDVPVALFQHKAPTGIADLEALAASPRDCQEAINALDKLSLISLDATTRIFAVHRLVQAAARDALGEQQGDWAQAAVIALTSAFPEASPETKADCVRLARHATSLAPHVPLNDAASRLARTVSIAAGDLEGFIGVADGLDLQSAALTIRKRLAQADPQNARWQRDLSNSHINIGSVLRDQGNLSAALEAFGASFAIRECIVKADNGNADAMSDVSISLERIGDVLRLQNQLPAALDALKTSRAIRETLARADTANLDRQVNLAIAHTHIGYVLQDHGELSAALDAHRASLAIELRLAEAAPEDLRWQRSVAQSHIAISTILLEQGKLEDAATSGLLSRNAMERLVEFDPRNAEWQRDLALSHARLGDVLRAQGDLPAALIAFNASLSIGEGLTVADPGNALWEHDLAQSLMRVGFIAAEQNDRDTASGHYRRGLEIMQRLVRLAPDHAAFKRDLAWFEARISELDG